jgi:hypothetical protein
MKREERVTLGDVEDESRELRIFVWDKTFDLRL